jgi:hypothetical protein
MKKKLAITLKDGDFSKLVELCTMYRYGRRNKSNEIAWLIKEEWERFQEEEREKTPAEIAKGIKAYVSRLEKKAADNTAPCYDTKIIQFPVRQFLGSA